MQQCKDFMAVIVSHNAPHCTELLMLIAMEGPAGLQIWLVGGEPLSRQPGPLVSNRFPGRLTLQIICLYLRNSNSRINNWID
jgi:hypothetical protein